MGSIPEGDSAMIVPKSFDNTAFGASVKDHKMPVKNSSDQYKSKLEIECTGDGTVGSNPTSSASRNRCEPDPMFFVGEAFAFVFALDD